MHAAQSQHAEMPLRVHVRFLEAELFARTYCRNNPKKGVKHLRCFPHCSPLGHREATFCGRPLNVEVTLSADESDTQAIDMHDLLYIGEFVPAWALHEQPRMQVSEQWIQDNLRTVTNPQGMLYKGAICSTQRLQATASGDSNEEKESIDMDAAPHPTTAATGTTTASTGSGAAPGATAVKTTGSAATEEEQQVSFLVRFNDSDASAWQCGIRTTANVQYAFCVRVLRLAPEIVGDAEDTYEEVFRALSPAFYITSARRLSGVKASARLTASCSSARLA